MSVPLSSSEYGQIKHTTQAVTNELRADKRKDTHTDVGLDVVVQVVRSEHADSQSRLRSGAGHDQDGDVLLQVCSKRVS